MVGEPEVSMYNPKFLETIAMCENIARANVGELKQMKLVWHELKDVDGRVYQIVPVLTVDYKY